MGVIGVPDDFSKTELEQFYSLLTNRENPILAPYKFAAALIHQDNGIVQVYLNVYPELDIAEYGKVNDEVGRQMDTILVRRGPDRDTRN